MAYKDSAHYWRSSHDWPAREIELYQELLEQGRAATYDTIRRNLVQQDYQAITYALGFDKPFHIRRAPGITFSRASYANTFVYLIHYQHHDYFFLLGLEKSAPIPSRYELQKLINQPLDRTHQSAESSLHSTA